MARQARNRLTLVIASFLLLPAVAAAQHSPGPRWPRTLFRADPAAVREVVTQARERGHALLVLALPEEREARLERIDEWSRYLLAAGDDALADLAACEVVGARLSLLRGALGTDLRLPAGDVLAVLIEPDAGGLLVVRADAAVEDVERELLAHPGIPPAVLRDRRWEAALRRAIAPDRATLERRARAERAGSSPAALAPLVVEHQPARARLLAERSDAQGAAWRAALARSFRARTDRAAACGLERYLPGAFSAGARGRCSPGFEDL